MRFSKRFLAFTAIVILLGTTAMAEDAPSKQEVVSVIQSFGKELKNELQKVMKSGGPPNAIPVCAEKAPEISVRLSRETGWKIRRVSLKARNPLDIPDAWERAVLLGFDKEATRGKDLGTLAHAETVTYQDGSRHYRFLKAIGTEEVCLNCHGDSKKLHPQAASLIKAIYPHDPATGYQLGMVRGAFSVTVPLDH